MTDLARLRKVGIVCAAASLAMLLSACDNSNLGNTLAAIKAIKVDDSRDAKTADSDKDHKKLNGDDLKLVANTARDLTLGQGGLLSSHDKTTSDNTANKPHKLAIDVVDPLKMPPPDDGGPLRVLPADIAAAARLQQAARALPDLPILTAVVTTSAPQSAAPQPAPAKAASGPSLTSAAETAATRLIQIGSFSSIGAAREAWDDLQVRYPVALRYKARFQPVTTADGRQMVRLKVGPVADAQALALCQALSVRDSWCARAG